MESNDGQRHQNQPRNQQSHHDWSHHDWSHHDWSHHDWSHHDLGRRRLDRGLTDALSLRRERFDHVALVVKRVWAIRLQCFHRNVNISQRYHAVERVMIVSDRYRELRDGLPSVLDKRGCLLWKQHQNSWRHHACGELRCRCTRHDSDFGVRPRRQGFD